MQWPPALRWLWWIVGTSWPDGDEQHMFFMSDDWKDASTALHALLTEIDDAKAAALAAYPSGQGIEAITAAFDEVRTGDHSLQALIDAIDAVSTSVFDTATDIQATKASAIASVAALAIEIMWAWVFPATAAFAEEAAIATTKSILRVIEDRLTKAIGSRLAQWGLHAGVADFIGTYAVKMGEAALISMAMDGGVQAGQIIAGERRGFNGTEFGASVMGSVVSTPFGREFAKWAGRGLDKLAGSAFAKMPVGAAGRGFLIGAGAGLVSNVTSTLGAAIVTHKIDLSKPESWVGGLARGGIAGAARGQFRLDQVPSGGSRPFTKGRWPTGEPGAAGSAHSMHTIEGGAPASNRGGSASAPSRAGTPQAQTSSPAHTSWASSVDGEAVRANAAGNSSHTTPSVHSSGGGSGSSEPGGGSAHSAQPAAGGSQTGQAEPAAASSRPVSPPAAGAASNAPAASSNSGTSAGNHGGPAAGSVSPAPSRPGSVGGSVGAAGIPPEPASVPASAPATASSPGPVSAPAADGQRSDPPFLGKPEDMKGKTRPKQLWLNPEWPNEFEAAAAPDEGIWRPGSVDKPFTMTNDSPRSSGASGGTDGN
ncbi:WXG100-like domain-containing protein [Nocardia heshunensis]